MLNPIIKTNSTIETLGLRIVNVNEELIVILYIDRVKLIYTANLDESYL